MSSGGRDVQLSDRLLFSRGISLRRFPPVCTWALVHLRVHVTVRTTSRWAAMSTFLLHFLLQHVGPDCSDRLIHAEKSTANSIYRPLFSDREQSRGNNFVTKTFQSLGMLGCTSRSLPNDPVTLNSRSDQGRWHPVYSTTGISRYHGNRDRRTEVILVPGHIGSAGRPSFLGVWPPANRAVSRPPTNRSSRHVTQQSVMIAVAPTVRGREDSCSTSCTACTRYFDATWIALWNAPRHDYANLPHQLVMHIKFGMKLRTK